MIKATRADKSKIIRLLTNAFKHNLSVNYVVKQDNSRLMRIRALMDYSFEICFLFGEVYFSEDCTACGLVLFPKQKTISLFTIWLDLKLFFTAITLSGILKALRREALIKKLKPDQEMAYLWFIGVDPLNQHKGAGTKLLKEILDRSIELNLPVFLETSTLKNLPWYERLGFKVYNELELNYTLFFLKKAF